MIKPFFEDVFVVLTYKNTEDIIDLLESIELCINNGKVIIVNSFFDDDTDSVFQSIAKEYNCDYVSVPNRGYGSGNNVGIRFALNHYDFHRLIISNPDIIIKEYDQALLNEIKYGFYGGDIICFNGKRQNPLRVVDCPFTTHSNYFALIENNKLKYYLSIILAKLYRHYILSRNNDCSQVFAVHGSFMVATKSAIVDSFPLYDENIFLFDEEIDIAYKLRDLQIPIYYIKGITVIHKEDGDMRLANINQNVIARDSAQYVYAKWN